MKLEDYFLNGTKLEANANKYTFVWKKSTEKYDKKGELDEWICANGKRLVFQYESQKSPTTVTIRSSEPTCVLIV